MTRVALATCAALPALDEDGPALRAALRVRGIDAHPEVWSDASVPWADYAAVVIRSTWDYAPQRARFLAWVDALPVPVLNRPAVLRWNTDKHYLEDLAGRGARVVPTTYLRPGQPLRWSSREHVVIKPAVSAGARDTARYSADQLDLARAHVERLHATGRTVMAQPYQRAIDEAGETALVFFAGVFSHAIRKGPMLAAQAAAHAPAHPSGLFATEHLSAREPSDAELATARAVLAAAPFAPESLVYARVDLVRADLPVLLELELCEPSLFLGYAPGAAERCAAAIAHAARAG